MDSFVAWFEIIIERTKTGTLTFTAMDVLAYEYIDQRRIPLGEFTQAHRYYMGCFISNMMDSVQEINNQKFIISLQRIKNRTVKVYKLELIE